MPPVDLGPALDLLLKFVPSIINAASALITTIKRKRPAAEIAGEASDMLGDVAAVVLPTLPYPDGHPAREAVELLPDVLAVFADGIVTRSEGLAVAQRFLDTGADMLAWAGSLPEGDGEDDEEPRVAVKVAAAVKRQGRKAARRHLRPASKPPRPIAPSALVGSRPKPPTLPPALPPALPPHSSPFGRPFDAVFGDAAGRPSLPGGKVPGGTPPEPPVDTRPPRVEIDDDTADVPPVVEAPPVVEVPPPATEPAPYVIEPGVVYTAPRCHGDGLVKLEFDADAWMSFVDTVFLPDCRARGWLIPLELTTRHIDALERARSGWLYDAWARGLALAVREEHGQGRASADAAWSRLVGLGIAPLPYLGSCANPEEYIASKWRAVLTGTKPGHPEDGDKWDGVVLVAPGLVAIGTGTTASIASGIKMSHSGGAWWGHPVAAGAAAPSTGAPPYFWTPASEERPNHPATTGTYIIAALERSIAEVAEAGGEVRLVSVLDLADIAARANFPPTWDMEKS